MDSQKITTIENKHQDYQHLWHKNSLKTKSMTPLPPFKKDLKARWSSTTFFLTDVPIVQRTSQLFVSQFLRANRDLDDRMPSHNELRQQLSISGMAGWTFIDLLSDYNLIMYLSKFLDVNAFFPTIERSQ
jgi:hypothetical protein